jgi:hypothetical protein
VGAFVAAAAAVVFLIATTSQRDVVVSSAEPKSTIVDVSKLATYPQEADSLPRYRVGALTPRSIVESGAEPLQMGLEGVATWTLGPNSRAVVRTTEMPHVVALERGSILAEVVPRHDTDSMVEAFIVEVGGTRVAVHGTVFSVERVGDAVHVEVTRGTVSVGPASYRGPTTGHVLASPARAEFDAATGAFVKRLPMHRPDGDSAARDVLKPSAQLDPRPTPAPAQPSLAAPDDAVQPTHPAAPTSNAPSSDAATPATSGSAEPATPAEVPKLSVSQAQALISSCLKRHAEHKTFVISSTLTVKLLADGQVNTMQFSPPLNPKFQAACGGSLFGKRIDGTGSVSFGVSSQ